MTHHRQALPFVAALLAATLALSACRPAPTLPATPAGDAVTSSPPASEPTAGSTAPTANTTAPGSLSATTPFSPLIDADLPGILLATGTQSRPGPVPPVVLAHVVEGSDIDGALVSLYVFYAIGTPLRELTLSASLPSGATARAITHSPQGATPELGPRGATWQLAGLDSATALGPFAFLADDLSGPVTATLDWQGEEGAGTATAASGAATTLAAGEGEVTAAAALAANPAGPLALALESAAVGRTLVVRPAPDKSPAAWQTAVAGEVPPSDALATAAAALATAPDSAPPDEPTWLTAWEIVDTATASGSGAAPEVWLRLPLPRPLLPGLALSVQHQPAGAAAWFAAPAGGSVTEDGHHLLLPMGAAGTYAVGLRADVAASGILEGNRSRIPFVTHIMRHAGTDGVRQAAPAIGDLAVLRRPELPFFLQSLSPEWVRLWLALEAEGALLHYVCGAGGCLVTWQGPTAPRLACPLMDLTCVVLPTEGPLACNTLGYDRLICLPDPAAVGSAPELARPDLCRQPCLVDQAGQIVVNGDGLAAANKAARGLLLLDGKPLRIALSATQDQTHHEP